VTHASEGKANSKNNSRRRNKLRARSKFTFTCMTHVRSRISSLRRAEECMGKEGERERDRAYPALLWRRLASARSNQSAQPRRHSKPSCWPTGPSPSRSPIRSRSRNRCRNRSQAAPDAASRVNPAGLIRSDRNPPRTHIHERHTHNGHKNPTTIGQR